MKIICVGLNYKLHNDEMGRVESDIPKDPVLFLKPDSAILKANSPFYLPDFSPNIEYEAEIVVRINRLGKNIAERFANRYYEDLTLGLDLTARDLQSQLKEKRLPWEISKGFDGSAVMGTFIKKESLLTPVDNLSFNLLKNNEKVQAGNTRDMLFSIDKIIAYASQFFTLKIGDLIFTGTPSGVGKLNINDRLEGFIGDQKLLNLHIL